MTRGDLKDARVSRSEELRCKVSFRVFSAINQVSGSQADDLLNSTQHQREKQQIERSATKNRAVPNVNLYQSKVC